MKNSVVKKVGCVILSYVVIYFLAAMSASLRGSMERDGFYQIGFIGVLQMLVIPVLFFAAGYFMTSIFRLPKMKVKVVLIAAVVFGALLWGLWYVSRGASAVCNLPVTQGCYTIDHWLRTLNVVYKGEIMYLEYANVYPRVILPALFFVTGVLYWFLYYLGNRVCVDKRS